MATALRIKALGPDRIFLLPSEKVCPIDQSARRGIVCTLLDG
jgi:hypothetical protein